MAKAESVGPRGFVKSFRLTSAAAAAALAWLPAELNAQVTLTKTSNTNWGITNGPLSVTFDPAGEEITSIKLNSGTNLLNPGGGTDGSLNPEFAGTPFGSGTQTFGDVIGPNNSYVDVWTTVASTGTTVNPITYAFHYVLYANDPTIQCYEVLNHSATDPATSVGQGQFLFRSNASLFPNLYQVEPGPIIARTADHNGYPQHQSKPQLQQRHCHRRRAPCRTSRTI